MGKLILYGMDFSPPVRACLLTLKALGVDHEYKILNVFEKEHLSEEFLKRNPQHTIPVLQDGDDWLWDSHAICSYLVDKYGKDDSLYPKDLLKRAVVNQRMYFEASVLFMSLRNISAPLFRDGVTVVPKEKTANIIEALDLLETFLGDNPYITGDTLTIADFSCAATASTVPAVVDISSEKYPKITAWLERLAKLPYYEEASGKGARDCCVMLREKLTEIEI